MSRIRSNKLDERKPSSGAAGVVVVVDAVVATVKTGSPDGANSGCGTLTSKVD